MLEQLLIGALLITLTLVTHCAVIAIAIVFMNRMGDWFTRPPLLPKLIAGLVGTVLWLIFGVTLSTWIWATFFILVGAFQSIEPALYFSIVSFTTLGFGDVTLNQEWRILGSLAAVNGLVIFGLNTAFLVEFIMQLSKSQDAKRATRQELEQ